MLFLDCMLRETGTRPASFDASLSGYIGDGIEPIETCDASTGMFSILDTVTQTTLASVIAERNEYVELLATEQGRYFSENVGDPRSMKRAIRVANLLSSSTVNGSSTRSSRALQPSQWRTCLPTVSPVSVEDRYSFVNCMVFGLDFEFWGGTYFDQLSRLHQSGDAALSWIVRDSLSDSECSNAPNFALHQCFKHDFMYTALAAIEGNGAADHAMIDNAWNPRNRSLVEYIFYSDIRQHGCTDNTSNPFIGFESAYILVCQSIGAPELSRAVGWVFNEALRKVFPIELPSLRTDNQWPVTDQEQQHWTDAGANARFVPCDIPRLTYDGFTRSGNVFNVRINVSEHGCAVGSRVDKVFVDFKAKIPTLVETDREFDGDWQLQSAQTSVDLPLPAPAGSTTYFEFVAAAIKMDDIDCNAEAEADSNAVSRG